MPCSAGQLTSSVGARVLLALLSAAVPLGCADNGEQPGCPAGSIIQRIESSRQLDAAVDTAKPGTCLALVSGSYEAVELPPGVSLVGDGREVVTLVGVTVNGGEAAVLSTFTVRGLGITIAGGATGLEISNVHVDESGGDGIDVQAGAAVTLADVEIDDITNVALKATDAVEVVLEDVRIARADAGIIARCASGCDCAAPSRVSLTAVSIADAARIGLGLSGVEATIAAVEVSDVRDNLLDYTGPRPAAVVATGCAHVEGHSLRISKTGSIDGAHGLLIDGASALLGTDAARGVDIQGATGGIWIQNVNAQLPVELRFVKLHGNQAAGLGIGPGSGGIVLEDIQLLETAPVDVPVYVDGVAGKESVGDAFIWHEGAQATVDELTIAASGRLGLIVDGPVGAGSLLGRVTLGEGSGALVQQNLTTTGALETTAETPPVQTLSTEVYQLFWPPLTIAVE
jgi:hypothetical protein